MLVALTYRQLAFVTFSLSQLLQENVEMEWNRTGDYRVSIKQDANVLPLELPT